MTTKLLIDRELLERIDESAICDGTDATISDDLFAQLVAALDAPRQPEGDGLEVVAWQDAENPLYTTGERRQMHAWATDGYPIVELCRLSDATRAIAELREECERLRKAPVSKADSNAQLVGVCIERDTLRQQLAEMTKRAKTAEREAGKALRTFKGLEKVAKVVSDNSDQVCGELNVMRQQRDRLAGLLRAERTYAAMPMSCQIGMVEVCHCSRCRFERIDTALAEVDK